MNFITQLFRLIKINWVMARHGMDQVVFSTKKLHPLRFLTYFNPLRWGRKKRSIGETLRLIFVDLGPIFVKFGQLLSTRRDLISDDIADALSLLQDQVPAFASDAAVKIIETAFGKKITDIFATFDQVPLASASIAQVHAATLKNGKKVVVKVLRPHIGKIIRRDLALMYTAARITEKVWPASKRIHLVEFVAEFERSIINELDLMREAANASKLRRNFLFSDLLYVPEIYWDDCHQNVMVMERIQGIPIADRLALEKNQINFQVLAERGVEIFFKQVFEHNFFHADMHPGNIFVAAKNPQQPQYIAVDFGIMGTLSDTDQRYLAENFLAFFKRDYKRVAALHVESGWAPADIDLEDFEAAIRTVCEPIFEKPLKDISFGKLLLRLFQTASRYRMEIQPQLMLLQKTLVHIEGLGRQLYPDLDLWQTAKPFLERWVKNRYGIKANLKLALAHAPYLGRKLIEMPDLLYAALKERELKPAEIIQQYPKKMLCYGTAIGFLIAAGMLVALNGFETIYLPRGICLIFVVLAVMSFLLGVLGKK